MLEQAVGTFCLDLKRVTNTYFPYKLHVHIWWYLQPCEEDNGDRVYRLLGFRLTIHTEIMSLWQGLWVNISDSAAIPPTRNAKTKHGKQGPYLPLHLLQDIWSCSFSVNKSISCALISKAVQAATTSLSNTQCPYC